MSADKLIIYEQPIHELIRVLLRIEQLFFQLDHHIADTSILGTRNVVAIVINLLQILDRPDLKAKLAKEISHQMSLLSRLENTQGIDQPKLQQILKQLEELMRSLIDSSKKIGQGLRDIELLNNLRLHLASPGSGLSFDIPIYHYWLHQPSEERLSTIQAWITEFNNIRTATELVLQLVREGSKTQEKMAENGFYQDLLDPQVNLRLVRVQVPEDVHAYPEISLGRHFLSVRWFKPSIQERPTQYQHHLRFYITHCTS